MQLMLMAVVAILGQQLADVSPSLGRAWHTTTLTWVGPMHAETDIAPNPFLDYRMTVTFSKGSETYVVPGFFAADGNAAHSGVGSGDKWRARFTPPSAGTWNYVVEFVGGQTGDKAAIDPSVTASAGSFDEDYGTFLVDPTDPTALGFRSKGRLEYVGETYLQFAETGESFLKGGVGSPENFLGYSQFDNTPAAKHTFGPHFNDWQPNDPTWSTPARGKEIIGALNYLQGQQMNTVYMLTFNIDGDGEDVFPWVFDGASVGGVPPAGDDREHFDCSKLDQWEIVFEHMDDLGIHMHIILQEQENTDNGFDLDDNMISLGPERQLYYRELVARFAHHLALTWNIGEENTFSNSERSLYYSTIAGLDAYHHPIVVHTFPNDHSSYNGMLNVLEGASLQVDTACGNCNCCSYEETEVHSTTLYWRQEAIDAGKKWVVDIDEISPGVNTDAADPTHDFDRAFSLWANLMAGGGGYSAYFSPGNTTTEDFTLRQNMLEQISNATEFFHDHLPFESMVPDDGLLALSGVSEGWCLSKTGTKYALYFPLGLDQGNVELDLRGWMGEFIVRWYNPRSGGDLLLGTVSSITGPDFQDIGQPPTDPDEDWAVVVKRKRPILYEWDAEWGISP